MIKQIKKGDAQKASPFFMFLYKFLQKCDKVKGNFITTECYYVFK